MHLIKITLNLLILLLAAQAKAQFGPAILVDTLVPPQTLLVKVRTADVNGDGRPDVIRSTSSNTSGSNTIQYYLNTGSGTFSPAQLVNGLFSFISDFAIDDFNSDGRPDLVVLDKRAMTMYLYPNTGGTFLTRSTITSSKFTQDQATVVLSRDFTGDGRPDLLVKDHIDVFLFAGLGNGLFDTARSMIPQAMQTELYHLVAGNFNGDAFMDFAVSTSGFTAFLNDGTGHFISAPHMAGTVCFLLAPGDLNGDGVDDMVMHDHKSHILLNNGSGTFTESGLLKPANNSYRAFSIADMDGDGDKDVYAVYDQQNRAVWFKNNGAGVLDTQKIIHTDASGGLYDCTLEDMDGNGLPDPIWVNYNGRIGVHLNTHIPTAIAPSAPCQDIRVYPNPAGPRVWVDLPVPAQLILTDVTGKTRVKFDFAAGRQMLTLPLAAGLYFIQIYAEMGSSTVKLIKEF